MPTCVIGSPASPRRHQPLMSWWMTPPLARILGYYSLFAAQLLLIDLQEADRKRLPGYPVPAIRMGGLPCVPVSRARDMAITCCMQWRGAWGCANSWEWARCWWVRRRSVSIALRLPRSRGVFAHVVFYWGIREQLTAGVVSRLTGQGSWSPARPRPGISSSCRRVFRHRSIFGRWNATTDSIPELRIPHQTREANSKHNRPSA